MQLQISSEIHDGWVEQSTEEYSLRYPKHLQTNNSGVLGTSAIIFVDSIVSEQKFNPNVNLIVQDFQGKPMDLEAYTQLSVNQVKSLVTNAEIEESSRQSGLRGEYQKVLYTGDQGIFHLKFEQYYAVTKQKAFVVTLTCEEDRFAECQGLGEKVMRTFVIK